MPTSRHAVYQWPRQALVRLIDIRRMGLSCVLRRVRNRVRRESERFQRLFGPPRRPYELTTPRWAAFRTAFIHYEPRARIGAG